MKNYFKFPLACLAITTCLCAASLAGCSKTTVYLGDGAVSNLSPDAKFEEVVSSRPTKDGMEFAGWYSDATYTDYINPSSITNAQKKKGTAYAKWITVEASHVYNVRSETATITDSGRDNQKMDHVPLSANYNVVDLQRAGYTSLDVQVNLELREIDDGYQYVFLYSNTSCTTAVTKFVDKYLFLGDKADDPSLLGGYKYEHGPGTKYTDWGTLNYNATVALSDLTKDIYVRYGASGEKDDDWQNRNVTVTVTPIK